MKPNTLRVISAPAPQRRERSLAAMIAAYHKGEARQRDLLARIMEKGREEARAKGERGVITLERLTRQHGKGTQ